MIETATASTVVTGRPVELNHLIHDSGSPPFFIVGCPRSGTTLLQVMLNRHPEICIPPELKLFCAYHGLPSWIRRKTAARIRHDLDIPLAIDTQATASTDEVYRCIWHELKERYAHQNDQSVRFGDKTPEYVFRLRWLNDVYPDSKLLFVLRDPRDVAISLAKAPWLRCNLAAAGRLWNRIHQLLCEADRVLGPNRIQWIRYESLISNPQRALSGVLDFLDVSNRPALSQRMLEPTEKDGWSFPCREMQWKANALGTIDPRRMHAWSNTPEPEIKQIESQCYESMLRAGYKPLSPRNPTSLISRTWGMASLTRTASRLPMDCWIAEFLYRMTTRG